MSGQLTNEMIEPLANVRSRKNRRSLRPLFRGYPMRMGACFASVALVGASIPFVSLIYFSAVLSQSEFATMTQGFFVDYSAWIVVHIAAALACLCALYYFAGAILAHKLIGPTINFERALDRLKEGRYEEAKIRLRSGDQLQDLAGHFNEFIEFLEKKENQTGS